MSKKEFYKGKIHGLIAYVAQLTGEDEAYLRACVSRQFPELQDRSKCAHCGANMEMKIYTANLGIGILLMEMARQVKRNVSTGMEFTDANRVHVMSLPTTDGTRHAVTQASYLNFVKQPPEWSGSGFWLITSWGWKALRGEPVLKTAKYFRGELVERGEETTTLSEMFRTHVDKVEAAIAKGAAVKADRRADVREFDPIEWTDFGGYAAQLD